MNRIIDVAGAVAGLLLTSPILAVCAVLIWREDGGPIIHRRRVVGLNGREFDAFKLRTMRVDADQWLASHPSLLSAYNQKAKLRDDPRVTAIGRHLRRFSVDEIPQLVNVVRGEMSLVGPRMVHPSELCRFGDFAAERQSVKPGVTGLWQVSGRQDVDYQTRVDLDRKYVRERSWRADLVILGKTCLVVLSGRGAH